MSHRKAAAAGEVTKVVVDEVTLPAAAGLPGAGPLRLEATSLMARHDDPVYASRRDVWEAVTRGGAVVRDAVTRAVLGRMCGLRKFGYWEDACYGYRSELVTVVAVEKENGENAQVAAFVASGGVRYWVVGSKNVPLVVRHDAFLADLASPAYEDKSRYQFAKKIARLLWDAYLAPGAAPVVVPAAVAAAAAGGSVAEALAALGSDLAPGALVPVTADGGAGLHALLATTGATMVCEAIFNDSQHLVDYSAEGDSLRAFALALPGKASTEGLTAVLPLDAVALFGALGVRAARVLGVAGVGSEEYRAVTMGIETRVNSEGAVMYYLDATGRRVVFMCKWKSHEYVVARRARQLILGGLPPATIASRVRDLSTLGVPTSIIEARLPYFLKFADWLRRGEAYAAALKGAGAERVLQGSWVTLNTTFASLEAEYSPGGAGGGGGDDTAALRNGGKVVIMFQGLPLTGKSTLARGLFVLLTRAGHTPIWLNQDEIPPPPGKGATRRMGYLAALSSALAAPGVTHIMLDKSNINAENVEDYVSLGVRPSVTVRMRHPEDAAGSMARLLETCMERFRSRGANHRTLREGETKEGIEAILANFAGIDGAVAICGGSGTGGGAAAGGAGGGALDADEAETELGMVISQSMTASPEEGLRALWATLASAGLVSEALTPLSAHPDEVAEALAVSTAFERLLGSKPKHTVYWGVALSTATRDAIAAAIPHAAVPGCGVPPPAIDWDVEAARSRLRMTRAGTKAGRRAPATAAAAATTDAAAEEDAGLAVGLGGLALDSSPAASSPAAAPVPYTMSPAASGRSATAAIVSRTGDAPSPGSSPVAAAAAAAASTAPPSPAAAPAAAAAAAAVTAPASPAAAATADTDRALIARAAPHALNLLPAVHYTLVYVGHATNPLVEVAWSAREGATVGLRVVGIAWDDRCCAAVVEGGESVNAHPHITLALRNDTPAVYSNELLARRAASIAATGTSGDVGYVALPAPLEVTGKVARNPL